MRSPEAMSTRVVPVSVMPAVCARIGVPAAPYVIVWSMPTNSFAGAVDVIGLQCGAISSGARAESAGSGLHKVDVAGKFARVDAAERQLAVGRAQFAAGLERDSDLVCVDQPQAERVVRHSRNQPSTRRRS